MKKMANRQAVGAGWLCAGILVLLGGCAHRIEHAADIAITERCLIYPDKCSELSKGNQTTTMKPQWGLALSGGGSRSASFNIGVLKAFYEHDHQNHIKDFDYISSVSGGSWASYWFYSKEMYKDCLSGQFAADMKSLCKSAVKNATPYGTQDMFRTKEESGIADGINTYRFQYHLENNSEILNVTKSKFMQGLESGMNVGLHGIEALTLHKIVNGVFDTVYDPSVLKAVYHKGLERTYGFVPVDLSDPEKSVYYNARRGTMFVWNDMAQAEDISFGDLEAFILHRARQNQGEAFRMPVPIINTAMGYSGETQREFAESVYWITPATYGLAGDGNTYMGTFDELDFSTAVAASGAAVDGQARGVKGAVDVGLWLVDGNLGYKVENPKSTQNKYFNTNLLPFPLYSIINNWGLKDERPVIRLSDGGHADNLGVYALVQRQVDNIVIIDAEHDPDMNLQALKYLGDRLEKEMGYRIHFDAAANDINGDSLRRISTAESVRTGSFVCDAICKEKNPQYQDLKFFYLKLSFDEDRIHLDKNGTPASNHCAVSLEKTLASQQTLYPCSVVDFYKTQLDRKKSDRFPHNSTADVFYDALQYRAYRDLGYVLAMEQLMPVLSDDLVVSQTAAVK